MTSMGTQSWKTRGRKGADETTLVVLGASGNIGRMLIERPRPGVSAILAPNRKSLDLLDSKAVALFFHSLSDRNICLLYGAYIDRRRGDTIANRDANTVMLQNVLQAIPQTAQFIFLSSTAVFGDLGQKPTARETPVNPNSWYGESKVLCEQKLSEVQLLKMPVVLRLTGVYGSTGCATGTLDLLIDKVLANKPLTLDCAGRHLRDWVFVDNVCTILYEFVKHELPAKKNVLGLPLLLASGESWTISRYVEIISKVLHPPVNKIDPSIVPDHRCHDETFVVDTRIQHLLGDLEISRKTAIEKTIQRRKAFSDSWRQQR